MAQFAFNGAQYEPSTGGGGTLPAGTYAVQMVKSDMVQARSGNGWMLVCQLSVIEGQYTGRRLTTRFNVVHNNPEAQRIGLSELSALSHVVGVVNWQDSQQLHGRPFKVTVSCDPRQDDPNKMSNDVVAYLDYMGNPPSPSQQNGAATGQSSMTPPNNQGAAMQPQGMGGQMQPQGMQGQQSYPQGQQGGQSYQQGQQMQPQGYQAGPPLTGAPQPQGQQMPQGMQPQGQWQGQTPVPGAGSTGTNGPGPAPAYQGNAGYNGQTGPMPGNPMPQGTPQGQGMPPQGMPQNGGAVPGSNQQQPDWNGPQTGGAAPSWAS